jgi:hypothetical protein
MCTVTFIPRKRGYVLGMNRDEQRARLKGLLPGRRKIENQRVIYPSEPDGGTWISLNEAGAAFALINWYSVSARVIGKTVSRGKIIPAISALQSAAIADVRLRNLPFMRINPFRLIAVFPTSQELVEWRWDLNELVQKRHRWACRQWISSGHDEATAQKMRSQTFNQFRAQPSAGNPDWVRRLHSSHIPVSGPFSTCMHRKDAVTVSFTQICVCSGKGLIHHTSGSPCQSLRASTHTLPLRRCGLERLCEPSAAVRITDAALAISGERVRR